MNITLKPEQEKLIQQQVALGRFNFVDEAVGRALQLLDEQYDENGLMKSGLKLMRPKLQWNEARYSRSIRS